MKIRAYMLTMVIVLVAVFSGVGAAKTVNVGTGQEYSTIAAGVNAASRGDIVNVMPGTYSIDTSIVPKSGVTVHGAGNNQTIVKTDSFSDISSDANPAMINIRGVSDVTVTGITFVGPATSKANQHSNGGTTSIGGLREARNGIKIQDASNIKISNCYFTLLLSDGIRVSSGSKNIYIDGCKFESAGHDSISEYRSSGIKVSNCTFDLMINTCIRFYTVSDCSVTKSTFIQNQAGTGAGYLEFEGSVRDVAINHNVFLHSSDPVVFRVGASCNNVVINDNILYHSSGISGGSGITTANNIVASSAQNWAAQGYGYNGVNRKMLSLAEARSNSNDDEVGDGTDGAAKTEESCLTCGSNDNETEESCLTCGSNTSATVIPNCPSCSGEASCISGNCTSCATCDNNTTNSVLIRFFTDLTSKYLDFSAEQAEISATTANESAEDLKKAKVLLNNSTAEEQVLGQKYLESSEIKLQYARDMLNLSQEGLDEVKAQANNTACINGEC